MKVLHLDSDIYILHYIVNKEVQINQSDKCSSFEIQLPLIIFFWPKWITLNHHMDKFNIKLFRMTWIV